MDTLTIEVATHDEWIARAIAAVASGAPQPPRYLFDTAEALLDTLSGNRFAILKALAGAGPIGVRELARRVGRDVRAVHADAQRLAAIGLIDKTADGKLHFPYEAVRIELGWRAAA
jgi:predicted transcriptional regulator